MPQSDQAPPSDPRSQSSDTDEKQEAEALWERTKHYAIIGAVCLVGALIAAAVIPRWWAQRLGDVADGSITVGSLLGIAMGLLGTIIPVWLVSSAIRNRNSERSALWYVIPAAVLAIPMLATLWIALGAGNGAEAGRDTLNVEAPGVRGGTYVGALVGLALAITLIFKLRAKRKEKEAANQAK